MRYTIPRDGEPALSFDGAQLAKVDSYHRGKHRWTALAIYFTEGRSYVVETVARSTVPGEKDWCSARAYGTAAEAVRGMRDRARGGALSKLALDLLEDAAEQNEALASALDDIEQTEEHIR